MKEDMRKLILCRINKKRVGEIIISPCGKRDKRFKLDKSYAVMIWKAKNGDLILPIPEDIVKVYGIELGYLAVFEIMGKGSFMVTFVKKGWWSFVEDRKPGE